MKKAFITVIASALLLALLCSCGYNTYSFEKIGDVLESSSDEQIENEDIKFTAELPSEEFLAQTDYYEILDDPSGEWQSILFKIDYEVTDFKYFNLVWSDSAFGSTPVKGELILSREVFNPGMPLVIDVNTEGDTACRGISFTDPNGSKRYYLLTRDAFGSFVMESRDIADYPEITVEYPDGEFLENKDGYSIYEDKSENYTNVLIKVSGEVSDFKFLRIEADNGNFKIKKVLYTLNSFSSDKPLVAETAFSSDGCVRGISFVDAYGITRYFTLTQSKDDNRSVKITEVIKMAE